MAVYYKHSEHTAFLLGEEAPDGDSEFVYVADLRSSEIYSFGGSAAVIWCVIDQTRTLDYIVAEVAQAFEETPETVAGSVRSFLDDLVTRDLLETRLEP